MDPNTVLGQVLEGLREGRSVSEDARSLNEWLGRGGFGPRVRLHPATDAWMMGNRYGTVERVGRTLVHVRMDVSGKLRKMRASDLIPVEG